MRPAILTTHFGNPFWVELLVRRALRAFPGLRADEVYVVDQDRGNDSAERLRALLGPVNVLRYPPSRPHFDVTGHDHAYVLTRAARDIDAETLVVFDSDAHPLTDDVGERVVSGLERADALLAADGPVGTWSHPCFMAFGPGVDRSRIAFDTEQLERGMDTGRKVYEDMVELDYRPELLRPEPAFGGLWGSLYLDGTVYHHGSGSFDSHDDPRFVRQVATWRREERLFRWKVARGRYTVSSIESRLVHASRGLRRVGGRVRRARH